MGESKQFKLRKNAEVTIFSLSSKDKVFETAGVFKGYTMLNQFSALIVKLPGKTTKNNENIRLIPEHMVLSVDVHKNGEKETDKKKGKDKLTSHYA